jgi:hypothetical protein
MKYVIQWAAASWARIGKGIMSKISVVAELSGGLNLNPQPWAIANNESVIAENCDFYTSRGSIMGRKRMMKVNAIPLPGAIVDIYRWVKGNRSAYLIVQTYDGINRRSYFSLDNGVTYTLIGTWGPSERPYYLCDYEDVLYAMDPKEPPVQFNGISLPLTHQNLLFPNDFSNAAWVKIGTTTATSSLITFGGTGLANQVYQMTTPSGAAETIQIDLRSNTVPAVVNIRGDQGSSSPGLKCTVTTSWQTFSIPCDTTFFTGILYAAIYLVSGDTKIYARNAYMGEIDAELWGVPPPNVAPTVVDLGGGGPLTGTYSYILVYRTKDGFISGNSPVSVSLTVKNSIIQLSNIPVSNQPEVTNVDIYRIGGLLVAYFFIGTVPNGTTTFLDNVADKFFGAPLDLFDRFAAPNARFATPYKNRIFVAYVNGVPNTFTWSRARRPLNFYDPATADPVGRRGLRIMGLREFMGSLFFIKEDTIIALRGSDENTFYLDPLYVKDGCASENSICDMGTHLGYAATDGYYMFNGISSKKATDKVNVIFDKVIDKTLIGYVRATYDIKKKRVYMAYPVQAINDTLLVMEMTTGAVHTWIPEIQVTDIYYDDYEGRTLVGDPNGFIYRMEEDNNPTEESYDFHWKSKDYDFGQPHIFKTLQEVRMTLDTKGQPMTVTLWADTQPINQAVVTTYKKDWVRMGTDKEVNSGQTFAIEVSGDVSKPIIIAPPILFKYDETDSVVSNVRGK